VKKAAKAKSADPVKRLHEAIGKFLNFRVALGEQDYISAMRLVDTVDELTSSLEVAADAIRPLRDIRQELLAHVQEQKLSYAREFENELDLRALSHTGSWPHYVIATVFRVSVDTRKDVVRINDDRRKLVGPGRLAHEIALLAEKVENTVQIDVFWDALSAAYEGLVRDGQSGYADARALHAAIAPVLKTRGKYTLSQFGIDLFRVDRDRAGLLELSPAQNASGGVYVPSGSGGSFVSALRLTGDAKS
jgi:hypothetical protein